MTTSRSFSWRAAIAGGALAALLLTVPGCAEDPDDSVASADGVDTTVAPGPDITVPAELEDFTGQTEVTVVVEDNVFEQRNIQVDPGTTITWVNEGTNNHNVTPATEGLFEVSGGGEMPGNEDPPTEVTATFDAAGAFPYYCSLHGTATVGQTGFVLVGDA